MRSLVTVECDVDTSEMLRTADASGKWIHAWPSRQALAQHYGIPADDIAVVDLTGANLRDRVRASWPDTGVLLRRGVEELVMLRPLAQPTTRVSIE